jgi:hypothetical protein
VKKWLNDLHSEAIYPKRLSGEEAPNRSKFEKDPDKRH